MNETERDDCSYKNRMERKENGTIGEKRTDRSWLKAIVLKWNEMYTTRHGATRATQKKSMVFAKLLKKIILYIFSIIHRKYLKILVKKVNIFKDICNLQLKTLIQL